MAIYDEPVRQGMTKH